MSLNTFINVVLIILALVAPVAFHYGYERQLELENQRIGE